MKLNRQLVIVLFFLIVFPIKPLAFGDEQSIIIEVDGNPHDWETYIEKYYPLVDVVQVYDTLLNGLALKGATHNLQKVEQQDFVVKTFPVRTYKVNANNSIPFLKEQEKASFDRLASSYTGKGVKVGVIDTGIDYRHPDLKKNFKGGYDVVDLDGDPMETLATQGEATFHGTHVAGIIGAHGKLMGMAPDAEIYGYRALGPGGVGSSVQVIAAIEQAVEDHMDIINLSLGTTINGPDWPTSIAVNKAVEMGVTTVIANGNAGPNLWTVGSPATAVEAISVGASTPPLTIPYLEDSFLDKKITLTPMMGSVPWNLKKKFPMADAGLGKVPLKSMVGKIALIKRGEIPFQEKAEAAQKAGAAAVLIYNNEDGAFAGSLTKQLEIPVASLSKKDGEWLLEHTVKANTWIGTKYQHTQDDIAPFSSKGPVTVNWDIKPDVVAPGVEITSTVPGGYMDLQGTSMASPHVAGALALIKEAHPSWGPKKLKASLLTTAKPLKDSQGEYVQPIAQGMGRIRPLDAINTETLIFDSRLTFGRIMQHEEKRTVYVTVENLADKTRTFHFDYPKKKQGLTWQLPLTFTVKPNEQKVIPIHLAVNNAQLEEGLHQGWITLLDDDQKEFHLPYLFISKDADFPRVMGLNFTLAPFEEDVYKYQMYLPVGAEELTVKLYDPDTLRYERTVLSLEDIKPGIVEEKISKQKVGNSGRYLAIVEMKNKNHYSSFEGILEIGE